MFLKRFKEKSNQKYINKVLSDRNTSVNGDKIKSVAIILNHDEFHDFEVFKNYLKELNLNAPKHKIIAFSADKNSEHSTWDTYFNPKDFGWRGKILNPDLETFINRNFDVLISYYKEDVLELNLIAAASKANFKVGISRRDERMYDLIIDVSPDEISTFKNELKKYLNILNKL